MRWLFPHMPDAEVNHVVFLVRKCAHLSEYAVLAMLVWRARRRQLLIATRTWSWRLAIEALWVAVLYAATDEFHQTFVPSREGCLRDVIIDSSGAAAALFLIWLVGRWRKLW